MRIEPRPVAAGRHQALQRAVTAPLVAAGSVTLVGLAAHRGFLLAAPGIDVLLLFVAAALISAIVAGLVAPRDVYPLPIAIAIALASSGTACLLLCKIAALRAAFDAPRLPPLPCWQVVVASLLAFAAGVPAARLGSWLRPRT